MNIEVLNGTMKRSALIFPLTAALILSACGRKSSPPAPPAKPPLPGTTLFVSQDKDTQAECNVFRFNLPLTYFQDSIEVPEDWENPNGRQIKVFYYGRQPSEGKAPLLFFNGGPASSSQSSYDLLEKSKAFEGRYQKHHLIFMDQRGTGCSDLFPSGNKAELARLRHYGSRSIVLDAEAIRKKMGYRTWKILGQSYGGDIVFRYAIVAPEGLTAAFVHGSVLGKVQATEMGPRLRGQKRVGSLYFEKYPGDRELIRKIRQNIPANYCITNQISGACGAGILDGAVNLLSFPDFWEELHNWFAGMFLQREGKSDVVFDDVLINWSRRTFLSNQNIAGSSAIAELESVADTTEDCAIESAKLKAAGDDPEGWIFNECRLFRSLTSEEAIVFEGFKGKDPIRSADLMKSLAANPNLKLHVYVGRLDAYTPLESMEPMRKAFGQRVKFTVFESGHDGYKSEESLWQDINE